MSKYFFDPAAEGSSIIYTCPVPENIAHGSKSYTEINVGSTVTYTCNAGYETISGDTLRICTEDEGWSGSTPVCGGKAVIGI